MFDHVDDAAVVDELSTSACREHAACARRLAAMGELYARRAPEDDEERVCWAIDGHANVVAEISAALNMSRGRAAGQLRYAIALREKLPKVAAVFATGAIDYRMMAAIVNRTQLITDAERMAAVDEALARHVPKWMRLSGPKLDERVDMWIARFDPAGVRLPNKASEDRYVDIAPTDPGMAGIWANVHAPDAAVLDKALDNLAATVCPNDPRTRVQRRADAVGALAGYQKTLLCACGAADCPAAATDQLPRNIVVHVLAEQETLAGRSEAPGYLPGFGAVPAAQVRSLAATAKIKPVLIPPAIAEPGYRPSAALAEFVRLRDLTCRFPGCDAPAEVCDVDHTIPYPVGPTHPSNLKLYCRHHHLVKTFNTGADGWTDRQLPDGTVEFTSPSGHVYTTQPGGAMLFPALAIPTGEITVPRMPDLDSPHRGRLMMPRRQRTRAQGRADRIAAERAMNHQYIAEEQRKRRAWLASDEEPPPF